jgi:hypothetical protein
MTVNFSGYVTTPVTLVTGKDELGNEYAYAKSSFVPTGWIDLARECPVGKTYIANFVMPNITKVRFGNLEMSLLEWQASGCPLELSREQITAFEVQS